MFMNKNWLEVRMCRHPDKLSFARKSVAIVTSSNCFYMLITPYDTAIYPNCLSRLLYLSTLSLTKGQVYISTSHTTHYCGNIFTILFMVLLDFISLGTSIAI